MTTETFNPDTAVGAYRPIDLKLMGAVELQAVYEMAVKSLNAQLEGMEADAEFGFDNGPSQAQEESAEYFDRLSGAAFSELLALDPGAKTYDELHSIV